MFLNDFFAIINSWLQPSTAVICAPVDVSYWVILNRVDRSKVRCAFDDGHFIFLCGYLTALSVFQSRSGLAKYLAMDLLAKGLDLLSMSSRPALASTQPSIQWLPVTLSWLVKQPEREPGQSPVINAGSRKTEVFIPTSIHLLGIVLNYLSTGATLPFTFISISVCIALYGRIISGTYWHLPGETEENHTS
jgi:hypothetical protein